MSLRAIGIRSRYSLQVIAGEPTEGADLGADQRKAKYCTFVVVSIAYRTDHAVDSISPSEAATLREGAALSAPVSTRRRSTAVARALRAGERPSTALYPSNSSFDAAWRLRCALIEGVPSSCWPDA